MFMFYFVFFPSYSSRDLYYGGQFKKKFLIKLTIIIISDENYVTKCNTKSLIIYLKTITKIIIIINSCAYMIWLWNMNGVSLKSSWSTSRTQRFLETFNHNHVHIRASNKDGLLLDPPILATWITAYTYYSRPMQVMPITLLSDLYST